MAKEWMFKPKDNWGICDVCGFKYRVSDLRLRWDKLWACPADWETRQPQDFVEARLDKIVADIQRPPPADVFVPFCSTTSLYGQADIGWADCAQADNNGDS